MYLHFEKTTIMLLQISLEGNVRVFLGALIQGEPATANLQGALTSSGRAYWMPTRGPTSIFSGSGPSKSSRPPGTHAHFCYSPSFHLL